MGLRSGRQATPTGGVVDRARARVAWFLCRRRGRSGGIPGGDRLDAKALSKSALYDIRNERTAILIPWSEAFIDAFVNGTRNTDYTLLAVPIGVAPALSRALDRPTYSTMLLSSAVQMSMRKVKGCSRLHRHPSRAVAVRRCAEGDAAETSTRWGGLEVDVPSPGTLSRCSDRAPQRTRRDR